VDASYAVAWLITPARPSLAKQDSAGAESCGLIPAFGGAHP